jgi:hypothetical protein
VQRQLPAGPIEGATQHFAVNGDNAFNSFGESCHEPLESGAELLRVKHAEQATEGVVAGRPFSNLRKPRRKGSFAVANAAIWVAP